MNRIAMPLMLAGAALVAACSTQNAGVYIKPEPTYEEAKASKFVQANREAIDALVAGLDLTPFTTTPMLVATVVNVNDLRKTAPLGRTLSEQTLNEEQARAYMHKLLGAMSQAGGSDLFISHDFPPSMKSHGAMQPLSGQKLSGEVTRVLAHSLMNERQREEFAKEMECNFAISIPGVSRFRVNVYVQQQNVAMVVRTIASEIPNFEKLDLPPVLKDVIMNKRGLVLVVGGTGSGKSTTLAALIDYRNAQSAGHIITVEDPVEYVHTQEVPGQPPRGGGGHPLLAPCAEEHAAPGARCDSDRRNSRPGNHGARHCICGNGSPVPGHPACKQRQPGD
jgi:ABC-type multidrug transport system fused ATPase/permease subunit